MPKGRDDMKSATLTRYAIVEDNKKGRFEPAGCEHSSKKDAVKELREMQKQYPYVYLAEVTYSRC